jgi:Protein of unknown function (DUF4240)
MDLFSGVVERHLYQDRSRAYEFFVLRYPPETLEPVDREGMTSLDVYRFSDQPKMGPAVVYEREIDTSTPGWSLADYQAGNDGPKDSFGGEVEQVLVESPSPMSDSDFWALIDVLKGTTARRSMNRLVKHLAKLGEPVIMGFAQSLAEKVATLDTPALLDLGVKMPGAVRLSGDAGLYLRYAVVADGSERFARAVNDPEDAWRPGETVDGELLGDAASEAFEDATGREVQLVTDTSVETGSNRSAWGDPPPRVRYVPPTDEEIRRDAEGRLRFIAELLNVDPADDIWFQYEHYSEWFCVRLFVGDDARVREVVVLFATAHVPRVRIDRREATEIGKEIARDYADRARLELLGEAEVSRMNSLYPMNNSEFMYTSRRFRGTAGEYLRNFWLSRHFESH